VNLKAKQELSKLFKDEDSDPESPRNLRALDVVPQKQEAPSCAQDVFKAKMSVFEQIKNRFEPERYTTLN